MPEAYKVASLLERELLAAREIGHRHSAEVRIPLQSQGVAARKNLLIAL